MSIPDFARITPDVRLGRNVRVYSFVNLYGCTIGDDSTIGTFVEIQKGVTIGSRVKISSHSFLCEGVVIEDNVWIGRHAIVMPGVTIGEGSVVSAGSVVMNPVAPNVLVAGNPARQVRKLASAEKA